MALERTSFGALREYDARSADDHPGVPPNLIAPRNYQELLESMVRSSPTFRRQCQRLAHTPDLVVQLESTRLSPNGRDARAETRITRKSGRVIAVIQLLGLADPVELIAHEIEHVIEQLDGVDLHARAALVDSSVRVRTGAELVFETTRAIRVGQAVAAEVRHAGR